MEPRAIRAFEHPGEKGFPFRVLSNWNLTKVGNQGELIVHNAEAQAISCKQIQKGFQDFLLQVPNRVAKNPRPFEGVSWGGFPGEILQQEVFAECVIADTESLIASGIPSPLQLIPKFILR